MYVLKESTFFNTHENVHTTFNYAKYFVSQSNERNCIKRHVLLQFAYFQVSVSLSQHCLSHGIHLKILKSYVNDISSCIQLKYLQNISD